MRTALAFGHPAMRAASEATNALAGKRESELGLNPSMLERVPEAFRAFLVAQPRTFSYLAPGTPSEIRQSFLEWQEAEVAGIAQMVERAIQAASTYILDHQLEWAVRHAEAGDLWGARSHAAFALRYRPETFRDFEAALRPLGVGYFFDDIEPLLRHDPNFLGRFVDMITGIPIIPPAEAEEIVKRHVHRKTSSVHAQILAAFLTPRFGTPELEALQWMAVVCAWPRDPIGFANAADALLRGGRIDEAADLIRCSPPAFTLLTRWHEILRDIQQRQYGPRVQPEVFYGQPYWRGALSEPVYPVYPTMEPRPESIPTCR